jgi:hypothetical protein
MYPPQTNRFRKRLQFSTQRYNRSSGIVNTLIFFLIGALDKTQKFFGQNHKKDLKNRFARVIMKALPSTLSEGG